MKEVHLMCQTTPFFFLVPEVFFPQTIPAHLLDGFISRLILMLLQL